MIATLTFHWATNYGAVLQAYALQKYLLGLGYSTEIIDYVPLRVDAIQRLIKLKQGDIEFFKKDKLIKEFVKNELLISKRYRSNKQLFKCSNKYDAIICGSDQIWNESFTLGAEGKPTLSYYANFASDSVSRISYAASFGSGSICDEQKQLIYPELKKFCSISVRENTAKGILGDINIDSTVVLDPTLLLTQNDYDSLAAKSKIETYPKVFPYIIHSGQKVAKKICDYLREKHDIGTNAPYQPSFGIYEWLSFIKNSNIVVTNSFHGIVFSLIFHKPFIAVSVENSGMNDRIHTLLGLVGLENRIIDECDTIRLDNLCNGDIDWEAVDAKLVASRSLSERFLSEALSK